MKINILFVNPKLFIGGAEVVIKNLCHHLDSRIFSISICCLKEIGTIGDELKKDGFDIEVLPQPTNNKVDYFTFFKLLKIIKNKNIHIIHSHSTQALVDACLVKLFLFHRCSHLSLVHTFHCGQFPDPKFSRYLLELIFCRISNQLVAVGKWQKAQIQKTYYIDDNSIDTIWNGVSHEGAQVKSANDDLHQKYKGIIIGTIATLFEQKGITYLLDVAAAIIGKGYIVTFLIIGEGPLRSVLEDKVKTLGLDNSVYFLGWIHNAAQKILPYFDIFFQPSLWEAMSIVILEAMSFGLPIVATKVGENEHIINNGVDGLLVESKNIGQMEKAIVTLINDRELRKTLGKSAELKYNTTFTADAMAARYTNLYLDIFNNHNLFR